MKLPMVDVDAARKQILNHQPNDEKLAALRNAEVRLSPHPAWTLPSPMSWDADPFADRNWRCQLHMLRWLEPYRTAGSQGDEEATSRWIDLAHDWFINNRPPWSSDRRSLPDAWSDMFESVRAVQLAEAVPMVAENRPEELPWLVESLREHLEWLSDASRLGHANHALHQHEGLLVCALVLEDDDAIELALARLNELCSEQWDHEGVNAEGAIAYHRNNFIWWKRLAWRLEQAGLEVPEAMRSLEKTPEELAHATRPDGTLAPIGDTDNAAATTIDHPACIYVTSRGAKGSPPAEKVRLYQDGYLFGRSGWGEFERDMDQETFFSLVFGRFKVHGHEDGGSVTYSARGVNWITDPGKYSYTHAHPFRKYVIDHDHHTLVRLEDERRKRRESVDLVSSHLSGSVWEAMVEDSAYEGTRIRRRVAYSTSGEYLVVVDTVRSDRQVTAVQRWQLGPNVQAVKEGGAVRLHCDGESALLAPFGITPECSILEATEDEDDWTGTIATGWKKAASAPVVEFSRTGDAFRFITVVAAGHRKSPTAVNLSGLPAGYFGLKVSNGTVTEKIVFGHTSRYVFDGDAEAETITAALESAAARKQDEPEAVHADTSRAEALELVERTRDAAWSTNVEGRRNLLSSFRDHAASLGLPQHLDMGLASVAADLDPRSEPGQYGARGGRGALLNWSDDASWRPTFYDIPVVSHHGVLDPQRITKKPAVHTVDLGRLVLPLVVAPDPGATLTVQFHGAIDRNKTRIPIFQRLEFQRTLEVGPTMNIADPTLDLASTLRLGWYMGVDDLDLHAIIARQIRAAADALGTENIVLQGGSGGGFAALQVGAFLPEASVVAFNPQTDVRKYHAHSASDAFEVSFGSRTAPTEESLVRRLSVIDRIAHAGSVGRLYLVTNTGDTFHAEVHEQPLSRFLDENQVAESHETIRFDLGPGHRSPDNMQYAEVLARVYADLGIEI
ncbi:heparinase II/III family protein [Rothia koreensis]|uniref:heparinase II/III domain-containing protein n=1 Tax=Rothia koreensis TaxID=592378 RepID=UPI0037CBE5F4